MGIKVHAKLRIEIEVVSHIIRSYPWNLDHSISLQSSMAFGKYNDKWILQVMYVP